MIEESEQGFLSNKFEDFGSEPIPNGWSAIEKELVKDRRRVFPFAWAAVAGLLLLSAGAGFWISDLRNTTSDVATLTRGSDTPSQPGKSLKKSAESSSSEASKNSPNSLISRTLVNSVQSIPASKPSQEISQAETSSKDLASLSPSSGFGFSRSGKKQANLPAFSDPSRLISAKNGDDEASVSSPNRKSSELDVVSPQREQQETGISTADAGISRESESSGNSDKKAFANEFYIPATKSPAFQLAENPLPGHLNKVESQPTAYFVPGDTSRIRKSRSRAFSIWIGPGIGYAQKTIAVNQAEAANRVDLSNSFNGSASWLAQIEAKAVYAVPDIPWLQALGGLSVGMYQQNLKLQSTAKQPISYETVRHDSASFGITPNWQKLNELRTTETFFTNLEVGVNPLISKTYKSGPYASVLVWTRISENRATTLSNSDGYTEPGARVAVGYKIGYQHQLAGKWQMEVFTTAVPQDIVSGTKGISVKPRIFGFSLNRKLW